MNNETHIVSLILHVKPEKSGLILDRASALPKSECLNDPDTGRLVLVFEAGSDDALSDWIRQINDWPGVLSSQLCYHHCESDESLNEEMENVIHTS